MVKISYVGKFREWTEREFKRQKREKRERAISLFLGPESPFYFFSSPPHWARAWPTTLKHNWGPKASSTLLRACSSLAFCARAWLPMLKRGLYPETFLNSSWQHAQAWLTVLERTPSWLQNATRVLLGVPTPSTLHAWVNTLPYISWHLGNSSCNSWLGYYILPP